MKYDRFPTSLAATITGWKPVVQYAVAASPIVILQLGHRAVAFHAIKYHSRDKT
jgi:hypothetical protein